MTPPLKLATFLAALLGVFGLAYLTGAASRGLVAPVETHDQLVVMPTASVDGYSVRVVRPEQAPGDDVFVELEIVGPDGRMLRDLEEVDGHPLHLIAFRRDLSGFQHVMPERGEGASWWPVLNLTPGPWHLVIDLQPTGVARDITVAADFNVSGAYAAEPLPAPAEAVVTDGLTVNQERRLGAASGGRVAFRVSDAGGPVTDLQPDGGELGHAVAIRSGDLGFLHLHAESAGTGPLLEFAGGEPGAGRYRVFVEFYRADHPYVAAFTVDVP